MGGRSNAIVTLSSLIAALHHQLGFIDEVSIDIPPYYSTLIQVISELKLTPNWWPLSSPWTASSLNAALVVSENLSKQKNLFQYFIILISGPCSNAN